MAITFVDSAFVSNDALVGTVGQNIAISSLTGLQAGDLLLVVSFRHQDDASWSAAPSGWSVIDQHVVGDVGTDRSATVIYKIAGASEPDVSIFHDSVLNEEHTTAVLAFRGVDTSNPLDVAFVAGSHRDDQANVEIGTNTDPLPSITTETDGAMVVTIECLTHEDITADADPSGYTNRHRNTGIPYNHRQIMVWSRIVTNAGLESPGIPEYTSSTNNADKTMYTIALKPQGQCGSAWRRALWSFA